MLIEVFSDCFAQRKNYLTEVDTRAKMLFVATAISIILLSQHAYAPLVIFFLSLVFLLSIRIPAKVVLIRLVTPLGLAGMVFLMQIFFYGVTPIVRFNLWGMHLIGYKEGLLSGSLIMAKVIGATSLVVFLSMTTPVNKLFNAARWFKLPNTWIETAMFTYRYIFVLLEDVIIIRDAQKIRLGYKGVMRSLKSLGELAGTALIRAYDQSLSIYEAMVSRGYNEKMFITYTGKFKCADMLASFIFVAILTLLLALNIYFK